MKVDLNLSVVLRPQQGGFDAGASDFLSLLEQLRRLPGFHVDWFAQWSQDGPQLSAVTEREAYLESFRAFHAGQADQFSIWAHERAARLYDLKYEWHNAPHADADRLTCEIYRLPGDRALHAAFFIDLLDIVTAWKPPLHLAFGPMIYLREHHPLDLGRLGLRWIGWVPFALAPSDIPDAEIVREMNGGTLIATQSAFWQAAENHPHYSAEAIARAQNVELTLNSLGVLPTIADLTRGGWGQ